MTFRKPSCAVRQRLNLKRPGKKFLLVLSAAAAVAFPFCAPAQTPDRSWPVAEYVRFGMPDPARFWLASDYTTFSVLLRELDRTNRAAFPRLDSANSSPLFARVINPTNTLHCLEADLPAADRLQLYQTLIIFVPSILDMYKLSGMDSTFHHETVELAHTHLHLLKMGLELDGKPMPGVSGSPPMHLREATITPWNSQTSPDNFNVPRKNSFGVLGAHAAVTLSQLLPWLGDRTVIPQPERLAATRYLNEDLPLLWPNIVPASRKRLMEDLVTVIEGTRQPDILEGLENLKNQLAP